MSGIATDKLTFNELKKIFSYAMENRIEPGEVKTKEEAKKLNKIDNLVSKLLGIAKYHTWQVGDKYYPLYVKAKNI